MFRSLIGPPLLKCLSIVSPKMYCSSSNFEAVFKFPSIKYIALMNRLKVYHLFGTGLILPSFGALEIANVIPEYTLLTASYIGLTGAAVLTLATLPFRNVIGFLYISEDNKFIKISFVDFWGKRKDKIVKAEEWIPLFDKSTRMDMFYLTPELLDGTKYKLFIKYDNLRDPLNGWPNTEHCGSPHKCVRVLRLTEGDGVKQKLLSLTQLQLLCQTKLAEKIHTSPLNWH